MTRLAVPGVVVDAKPVTARLAHGVLPVQVAAGGEPVVEHPLLQVLHHCLISPHPVACSACCPASGKHPLCVTAAPLVTLLQTGFVHIFLRCKGHVTPACLEMWQATQHTVPFKV